MNVINEHIMSSFGILIVRCKISEGVQEVGVDMREILKGLRELKKSSALAFQMLKVLSEEHDYSAVIVLH